MKEYNKKMSVIRKLLKSNFHISDTLNPDGTHSVVVYYGCNDPAFYYSKYCKPIIWADDSTIDELYQFAIIYNDKRRLFHKNFRSGFKNE